MEVNASKPLDLLRGTKASFSLIPIRPTLLPQYDWLNLGC